MIVIFFTIIFGALGISKNTKALTVVNYNQNEKYLFSASAWGPDASYIPYELDGFSDVVWDRSDERGDLLVDHTDNKTYYVASDFKGYLYENSNLKSGKYNYDITPLVTNVPSGSSGIIEFKNQGPTAINVSISRWSDEDDGAYITIPANSSQKWARNDPRGYIMHIKESNSSYYIKSGVEVDYDISKDPDPKIDGTYLWLIVMEK